MISIRRLNDHGVYDLDLSRSVLQEIDLSGLCLTGSKLIEARCYATNFKNSDLRYAHFDKAMLKKADFSGALLTGATLQDAILDYANLRGADLRGADLSGTTVSNVIWNEATYDNETIFPFEFDRSNMKTVNASVVQA